MYISKIKINNFRNFQDNEIKFNDGVNVIIGHNNAGKSNLIRALGLVINQNAKRQLNIHDFNMKVSLDELKKESPKISITVFISKGKTFTEDDLVAVSEWLTKLDENYEAQLTYEFFLPEKHEDEYSNKITKIIGPPARSFCAPYKMKFILDRSICRSVRELKDEAFKLINNEFLRFYTYKIWGGEPTVQNQADGEALRKFDFQFLDAIRDVEKDLISGRNVMLKDVLKFFLDYDIKSSTDPSEVKDSKAKQKSDDFLKESSKLIEMLDDRIKSGKEQILSYAKDTGASLKSEPNFQGETSDIEMLSFLKLIIEEKTGFKIPASHNGLGYNNLIYISILLAKMQADADEDYLGSNSKVFPILVIEEPEAHLHPSMQDKFLKFLKGNISKDKVRQIFITSHSTHVTSAIELDEIICLHHDLHGSTRVGYLGKVFEDNSEGVKSKKYVKRFLDATKSNMLFAEKIILVEGIAEQLLISILAKYLELSLEDHHIAVINIGGRYFNHFLKLFDVQLNNLAILKKVVCLTDRDPERKVDDGKFKKCYPFEYEVGDDGCEYKDNATCLVAKYENHKNIRFFSQENGKGKTFEYDLVLHNPQCDLLITDSMSNREEIRKMMSLGGNSTTDDCLNLLSNSSENDRIKLGIENLGDTWTDEDKIKAIIASRYLNSIGKGANALELAYALEENLENKKEEFVVPTYIEEALEWITQ